jgi:CheY-like chemotaxis protein
MNNDQSSGRWQASIGNDAKQPPAKIQMPATFPDGLWGKKTVLLVDVNPRTRDSRAKIMRSLGVTVHCAATARTARSRCESESYNLVLVDLGPDVADAERLVEDIKSSKPRQLVGFLVGSPLFVASSLKPGHTKPVTPGNAKPGAVLKASNTKPEAARPGPSKGSTSSPAADSRDFAQRVKDAEAEALL